MVQRQIRYVKHKDPGFNEERLLRIDLPNIKTFGLKVVRGRNLEPGDYGKVCMFNEAAYKHFEFENLEGKRFNNFGGFDIIGVVNDFQYSSLHKTIGPVCIMFTGQGRRTSLTIRMAEEGAGPGMDYIRTEWQKILPEYPLKYQIYDEWLSGMLALKIALFTVSLQSWRAATRNPVEALRYE